MIIANFDKREHIRACRRLPSRVDIERLRTEVLSIPAEAWGHQRAPVHRHTRSVFMKGYPPVLKLPDDPEQPILGSCPYIRELIYGLLAGQVGKCLIASLEPMAMVYPHTDTANDYFIRSFRIHVPIVTNPKAKVFCNGRFFHMAAGEAWLLNNLAPHAVINDDPQYGRIHLIFDVFPDQRSIELVDELPEADGELRPDLLERMINLSKKQSGQNE